MDNLTGLTELEQNKVKRKICPKCSDRLEEFSENGEIWAACDNYYCRWEIKMPEQNKQNGIK